MAEKTHALTALQGTEHKVLTYSPSQDHFGTHAAEELELDPASVLKTLVITHERELAICCVPVDGHLSLKAAAKALGWKRAEMAEPAKAQRATGYVVGGISPLGTKQKLKTLIDASVADLPAVSVSAGQRGLSAQLHPHDLAALTGAEFAPISAP